MDPKIWEQSRGGRYAYEAYEFVCDSVSYTQERLVRALPRGEAHERHVKGEELLRGACELAVHEFGMMAPVVFRQWGLLRTDDFGAIVFELIACGKLSRSDDDDPADFQNVFDLHDALAGGFELTCADYSPRRTER